ncbi:HD-GYP domain-containing protein [Massilia sp. LjRoot122]|uniref:HD-GYP domain-containing protein n=1 Tax=Massilia sp. LjRoot122 TaxID=3342257 RepID=UPI003ED14C44
MSDNFNIPIDQLQVGLYIHLDLKWFEHPFAFSHFKIKNEEQLRTIRSLGLKTVRYDPALSDVGPAAGATDTPPASPAPAVENQPEVSPELQAKRAMMERIKAQRQDAARVEHAFINTAKAFREIDKNLFAQPAESLSKANQLITQMVDSILSAPELAIHVMGDKTGGEEIYNHSLNVTTLSMMIARDIKLPQEVAGPLAMGALFHDVGHKNISDKVLSKMDPLTQAEKNLYELHCHYGTEIGERLGFPRACMSVIADHHEAFDGSGYPRKLKGEAIGVLPRIVAIANCYDELCNPVHGAAALTPHETLSIMFTKLRSKFDPKLLQVFIRCLGVYPPGTIVQLSNGVIGMVATVNMKRPMKPVVVIYDAGVSRDEAILVDMDREPDLNIVKSIRPAQVPQEIYHYLSPRKRVSYYFDASTPGAALS